MNKLIISFVFVTAFSMLSADQFYNRNQNLENQNYRQDSQSNIPRSMDDQRIQSPYFNQNPNDQDFQNRRSQDTNINRGMNQNSRSSRESAKYLSENTQTTKNVKNVSDKELFENLQKKLGPGWFSKGYETVSFKVSNGNVLLQGTVETPEDKNNVSNIVKDLEGVRSFTDQIQVTGKKESK